MLPLPVGGKALSQGPWECEVGGICPRKSHLGCPAGTEKCRGHDGIDKSKNRNGGQTRSGILTQKR